MILNNHYQMIQLTKLKNIALTCQKVNVGTVFVKSTIETNTST